ncbi:atp-dependent clp atp-binding subunit [Nannochloropsis gaditana]|uniref:Atp-dependent clp atp-binding subunit n=1 Tax=Nannochloropsis gaditana TaxID=72520 RepID=W7T3B0_9STRA|nr:atp-dependent clp atp-binding subunit [Nannochloropsis gaditana]
MTTHCTPAPRTAHLPLPPFLLLPRFSLPSSSSGGWGADRGGATAALSGPPLGRVRESAPRDSQGRTVDFRNTIIIMTSNLGAQYLSELPPDKPSSAAREDVMRVVRAALPPEFINRYGAP